MKTNLEKQNRLGSLLVIIIILALGYVGGAIGMAIQLKSWGYW